MSNVSAKNAFEQTLKNAVDGFWSGFSHQLSDWLRENKGVETSPEEICSVCNVPFRPASTPAGSTVTTVMPNIPSYYSGTVSPAKKKGGRSKKPADPSAAKCEYTMSRGKNQGQRCDAVVANDGTVGSDRFCKACLKKAAVKALVEGSSSKSTVQPPHIPGTTVAVSEDASPQSTELNVVQIPDRDGYFREATHGFIVHQTKEGTIVAEKIDDNGVERDLNDNERKIAVNMGLQVQNKVIKISTLPAIPTIPNIAVMQM